MNTIARILAAALLGLIVSCEPEPPKTPAKDACPKCSAQLSPVEQFWQKCPACGPYGFPACPYCKAPLNEMAQFWQKCDGCKKELKPATCAKCKRESPPATAVCPCGQKLD
jgi:hypothetical protein